MTETLTNKIKIDKISNFTLLNQKNESIFLVSDIVASKQTRNL